MISVSVLVLYTHLAISTPTVKRLFRQSAAIVERDIGVRLRPHFLRRKNLPRANNGDGSKLIRDFSGYFARTNHRMVLIVAPALEGRSEVAQGMAPICGNRAILSVFSKPLPVLWQSNVYRLTHELGHMLGATHTDDLSVMLPISHRRLYFNEVSKNEIKECVGAL